jgi:beta-lactamase superfamily II metal-dependent hydrolase
LSAGLLAPRHGCIKSSGAAFIRAVNLALALVLTNYGNRYGFPARELLARNLREGYRSANRRYRHSLPWCFASQKITRVLARQPPGIAFSD